MNPWENVGGKLLALAGAGLLAACAATVVSVERASELPPGVDRTCVEDHPNNALPDERPVIIVMYRVGKAPVTKAYVEAKGDRWLAGDSAVVHPTTCRIKRAPA